MHGPIIQMNVARWVGERVAHLVAEAAIRGVGGPDTNVPDGIVDENILRKVRSRW